MSSHTFHDICHILLIASKSQVPPTLGKGATGWEDQEAEITEAP